MKVLMSIHPMHFSQTPLHLLSFNNILILLLRLFYISFLQNRNKWIETALNALKHLYVLKNWMKVSYFAEARIDFFLFFLHHFRLRLVSPAKTNKQLFQLQNKTHLPCVPHIYYLKHLRFRTVVATPWTRSGQNHTPCFKLLG